MSMTFAGERHAESGARPAPCLKAFVEERRTEMASLAPR